MWKAFESSSLAAVVGVLLGSLLVGGTSLGGCSSAPSMDMDAPIPTSPRSICAVRHPCPVVPAPEPEEVELCHAIFADMEAECRAESVALFICSMRATRCDAEGDIDDEATFASLDKHCTAPRGALERCCEQAGGDNVHCGLFRDEGEAFEGDGLDEDGADEDGADEDGAGD